MNQLPQRDETKTAEQQGLFQKFIVTRTDGKDAPGQKHCGCGYFVLDVTHDIYAKAALSAYAAACAESHPDLSNDMVQRYVLPLPEASDNDPFTVRHASVSDSNVIKFAEELEATMREIANGKRKPSKIPMEPVIALIQYARNNAKAPSDTEALRKENDDLRKQINNLTHPVARLAEEWTEEDGNVIWHKFPIDEPPYVGTPLDSDWVDDYYTHWQPLPPIPSIF